MKEEWLEVEGYRGIYFVSNTGRVKSIDHYPKGRTGKQNGRILSLQRCYKGYLRVTLSMDGKPFTTGAHRLVAISFIPNPKNKQQVNHINGIKDDNRVENLEWCTNSENQIHAVKNNLCNPNQGELHHASRLKNEEVIRYRKQDSTSKLNRTILANKHGVSITAISNMLLKKSYKKIN